MPHLILEYTNNVDQPINANELFGKLHRLLADVGDIDAAHCKSRLRRVDHYYIASGETDNAFVHLDMRFLQGRSLELKQEIGRQSLDVLKDYFAASLAKLQLQITVDISDIERQTYFKIPDDV